MGEIITWIKLGKSFINQENIRGVSRMGDKTRIERIAGDDVIVEMDYDKVKKALPEHL